MKVKLIKKSLKPIQNNNTNKKLIGDYTAEDLKEKQILNIYSELTPKEIKNLKYINSNTKIIFHSNSYLNLENILIELKILDKNNKVIVDLSQCEKTNFNNFIFSNNLSIYDNISIAYTSNEVSLKKYIYFEKLLYQIVEPALNLSPFEKYIYAYNITKQFKEYKEEGEENNPYISRNLYSVLDSEYMVCVGYSRLLIDLLDKLGIRGISISIKLESETDSKKLDGHTRSYIYLVDEKYGIDGFYTSDPTWDNDLLNDYYNHLVLTNKEALLECKFSYLSFRNEQGLFDINSIEDLFQIIELNKEKYCDILIYFLKKLKELDPKYVEYLEKKYEKVLKSLNNMFCWLFGFKPNINNLLYEMGTYILEHVNKTISGDTIMDAVEVIYRHSYGYNEEDLQNRLEEVRKLNANRHACLFPKKYAVDNNGSQEIVFLPNKFRIEEQNKIK